MHRSSSDSASSRPGHVATLTGVADGVVVGSAIVDLIGGELDPLRRREAVRTLVAALRRSTVTMAEIPQRLESRACAFRRSPVLRSTTRMLPPPTLRFASRSCRVPRPGTSRVSSTSCAALCAASLAVQIKAGKPVVKLLNLTGLARRPDFRERLEPTLNVLSGLVQDPAFDAPRVTERGDRRGRASVRRAVRLPARRARADRRLRPRPRAGELCARAHPAVDPRRAGPGGFAGRARRRRVVAAGRDVARARRRGALVDGPRQRRVGAVVPGGFPQGADRAARPRAPALRARRGGVPRRRRDAHGRSARSSARTPAAASACAAPGTPSEPRSTGGSFSPRPSRASVRCSTSSRSPVRRGAGRRGRPTGGSP